MFLDSILIRLMGLNVLTEIREETYLALQLPRATGIMEFRSIEAS